MTANEHYRRALSLVNEVVQFEKEAGGAEIDLGILASLNANCMRKLKIAELHMRMAEYKK